MGPFSEAEVFEKLERHQIEWVDYVFDEAKKDWVLILEHEVFKERPINPKANSHQKYLNESPKNFENQSQGPANKLNSLSQEEWFVLKDQNKYGPFVYLEIVRLLQEQKIHDFDYLWCRQKMNNWSVISEIPEFSPEEIKKLRENGSVKIKEVFFRRRHQRIKFGSSILLHDKKEVWRGNSIEIGAGGAGLVIESDKLNIGQNLFLHFQAGDGVPPFNTHVTIVSKKKMGSQCRYGVRFIETNSTIEKSLQMIIAKKIA